MAYNQDCKISTTVDYFPRRGRTDKELLETLDNDGAYAIALVIGCFVREHLTDSEGFSLNEKPTDTWDKQITSAALDLEEKLQDLCMSVGKKLRTEGYETASITPETAVVSAIVDAIKDYRF